MTITATVAALSTIVLFFRPRDLRREIGRISKLSQTFRADEVIGEYTMGFNRFKINSDRTYRLELFSDCSFGRDFVACGSWSLDGNVLSFIISSSPTNLPTPVKWAFATTHDGEVVMIPDLVSGSYIDRGYLQAHFFRRQVAQASRKGEDQSTD